MWTAGVIATFLASVFVGWRIDIWLKKFGELARAKIWFYWSCVVTVAMAALGVWWAVGLNLVGAWVNASEISRLKRPEEPHV